MAAQVQFEDAERAGVVVVFDADPQVSVTPGERADTAIVISTDGTRRVIVGDYREVKVKIQAAAAQGHEGGDAPRANTPMS